MTGPEHTDTTLARVRTLSDRERMMLLAYLAGHDPDVLTVALDAMEASVLPFVREGYESPFTAGSATEAAQCAEPGPDGVTCTRQAGHDGLHYTLSREGAATWQAADLATERLARDLEHGADPVLDAVNYQDGPCGDH